MRTFQLIKISLLIVTLFFVVVSCKNDNKEESITPPKSSIEDFSQTNMSFSEEAGEQTFSFTANGDWTVDVASTSGGDVWCKASPTKGKAGSQTVKITTTENETYDDRSVTVTLKSGDESRTFVVTQKQKNAILINSNKIEVAQKGGTITVEVKANVNYTATIGETCQDWITESSNTRALSTTEKTYSIAANEDNEKREGTITFMSGNISETVHVYQAGGDIILLSKNEYYVDASGEDITVELRSNCEYEVEMPDVDWIHNISSRAMSSHTLYYTIDVNETYDNREAKIVYRNKKNDVTEILTIVQAQKNAIILGQKEAIIEADGEIIEVKLSANVDYEVEMPNVDWITTTATRGLTEHTLYYKIAKNENEESRSAKIIFASKNDNLKDELIVTQRGKKPVAKIVINLAEAGTLANYIEADRLGTLTEIKITGSLNMDDIETIGQMTSLRVLDLSEADIIGGGTYKPDISDSFGWCSEISGEDDIIKTEMLPLNIEYFYAPESLKEIYGSHYDNIIISAFRSMFDLDKPNSYLNQVSKLKNIELHANLTTIGIGAFGQTSLTEINIPDNVSTIEDYAFYNNEKLQQVTFGSNLKSVGFESFAYCRPLSKIELPEGVEEVKGKAFYECSNEYIYLPSTLKHIGEDAFYRNGNNFPQKVDVFIPDIDDWLEIDFDDENSNPVNAKRNESNLYVNHSMIKSLIIPQGHTSIKNYAFVGCTSIQDVTIGHQVTTIGISAFKDCSNLTKVKIGDNVSTISMYAFYCSWKLDTIYIGKNVTEIQQEAFFNIRANEVHCLSTTPPSIIAHNQFNRINKETAKLYVPKGTYQAYYLSNWGTIFTNIIEMEE